jgi:hypothetical protein
MPAGKVAALGAKVYVCVLQVNRDMNRQTPRYAHPTDAEYRREPSRRHRRNALTVT